MADDAFKSVNVLIVDDGMFSRQTLERTLNSMGVAQVVVAETGNDALRYLEDPDKKIHIVVTDIMMRGMDGYELIKRIRRQSDSPYKDIPILVLTGQMIDARKRRGIEDLIHGFIEKPATVKVLTAEIGNALGL